MAIPLPELEQLTGLGRGSLLQIHGGDEKGLTVILDHLLESLTRGGESSWHLLGGLETLGLNFHPLILHFPIAFLVGFALCDLYGVITGKEGARRVANALLHLGAVGSIITVISGLIAAEQVPHGTEVHEIMTWHQWAGITIATLSSALSLGRAFGGLPASTMAQGLSLLMTGLLMVILFLGADLGGTMVYQYGVAVQKLQSSAASEEHHHHGH